MRDRLRSRGVQVLGPIDHGFTQSIYFDGPEGLNLEISCGTHIDGEAWIDPEVVGLCGITEAELEALKEPTGFEPTAEPVPQPARPHSSSVQRRRASCVAYAGHGPHRRASVGADERDDTSRLAGGLIVEFGLFDHIEGIPGTSMHQLLRDRIELVKMLDAAGFTGYHVAEHHGTDLCLAPDQEIFLAAAAEATSQIRLGPMVKLLPLHHPLRVLEDICVLDQLTGGRVEYGVGRGIAAIEHFWFDGDWFNSHDRFEEALTLILQGLRTGRVDPTGGKHYSFPPIDVSMSTYQQPNPPFWYPGNPVTAGRFGLNLMWPGPIPQDAYDLYVQTWHEFAGGPVRAEGRGRSPASASSTSSPSPTTKPRPRPSPPAAGRDSSNGSPGCTSSTACALDDAEAEAALNPQAHAALALIGPGGDALLPEFTAASGTPAQARARVEQHVADGRCDYLVLQLPTGDMTFEEAKGSLQLFIDEVMPDFV